MRRLVVGSRNPGKVGEIRTLLAGLEEWEVHPLPPELPEPEETGSTFIENASLKARFYSGHVDGWVVADDSGIGVDALDGGPGLYSARFAPTDEARNRKILDALAGVPEERRGAEFVCALALAREGGVVWTFEQRVRGRIAPRPAGTNGFGYDPIFWTPEFGCTMGELEPEVKNRISHRGLALARLRVHLETF